jgi:hypothetical protein
VTGWIYQHHKSLLKRLTIWKVFCEPYVIHCSLNKGFGPECSPNGEECDNELPPDDGQDIFSPPPVDDSDDEDIDLDAIPVPSIFDLDKKAQFDDCGMHRALASCERDVDADVIYVKDGKLGDVKKRKDDTRGDRSLYSRWTTQRGSITGVKPFVRNGRGRASLGSRPSNCEWSPPPFESFACSLASCYL